MSDNQKDGSVILSTEQRRRVTDVLMYKGVAGDTLYDLTTFNEFDHWWSIQFAYRYSLSLFLKNLKLEGIE